MSDLVERLRVTPDQRPRDRGHDAVDDALREAADEIERLQRELETANGLWTFWNEKAQETAGKLAEAQKALHAISSRDEHGNYRAKNYPKPPPDLQAYNDCGDIARRALRAKAEEISNA